MPATMAPRKIDATYASLPPSFHRVGELLPSGIKMVPSLHSPFNLCPIAHLAMNTKEPPLFRAMGRAFQKAPSLLSAGRIMALPFSHSQPSPETAINDFTPLSSFQTLVNYTAAVASSLISHPKNFAAPLINYTRHPPSLCVPSYFQKMCDVVPAARDRED